MEATTAQARVVASSEVGVVVGLVWQVNDSDEIHRRYEALKLRDGLVYDIKDFREERAAPSGPAQSVTTDVATPRAGPRCQCDRQ